jgi:Transglutaminase-like superfamily
VLNQDWYARQSAVTEPGQMAGWLPDFDPDLAAMRRIASCLVTHYRADDLTAIGVPKHRLVEVDSRYADTMLERLKALDERDISEPREPLVRIVGCCRDFTVLYLTQLRHHGIPARARVGFATYFEPGWNVDHEVAEVWDAGKNRWRLIDAQLADNHVDPTDGATFDALDVPRNRFVVAGEAWAACRAGRADPERFVVDPGLDIPETRSWLQLKHNLVQDLAALNRREMLLWDDWGLGGNVAPAEADLSLLDRVADLTRTENASLAEIREIYESEPGLRVPDVVTSFNPLTGKPHQVAVRVDSTY